MLLNKFSGKLCSPGHPARICILALLPLLLFFANGCSVALFNGYHRLPGYKGSAPVSWFQSDTAHSLFNTKIDLMKNHFSGLMVIKPVAGGSYRVVFITEVGLKIFDMEFLPDREAKLHYIMDAMDRKVLIKTLSNDISLLLMIGLNGQPKVLGPKNSPVKIFRYRYKGKKSYIHMKDEQAMPFYIKQASCLTNKVGVNLYGRPGSGLDSAKIRHFNFRLSLDLYRIKENQYVIE